jgi:hypothetical protein
MKPRVFIGSSVEGLTVAYAIQQNLEYAAEVTVWPQGIFQLSRASLDSLIQALDASDFGVFVFTPDDVAKIRGNEHNVVRDNVIFELGLFVGRLGVSRTVFVKPREASDLHIPSDLAGITPATYSSQRIDDNIQAALGPACTSIANIIQKLGSARPELTNRDAINRAWTDLVAGAKKSVRIMSGDASWACRDAPQIAKLTNKGIAVSVLCEAPMEDSVVKENVRLLLEAGASVRLYTKDTQIRAIITDWSLGGNGFALRIQRTAKSEEQIRRGEPGNAQLYNYFAKRYFPHAMFDQVESLGVLFDSLFESGNDALVVHPLQFSRQQIASAFEKSGIKQYAGIAEQSVDLVPLTISDLWSPCRFVKQPRLSRVQQLLGGYSREISRFEPVCCTSSEGTRVVFPPIVEKNRNRYVVIDGMHRLFSEFVVAKRQSVQCIVVSNDSPLPSELLPFRDVSIVYEKRPRSDNFPSFDGSNFREMKRLDSLLASAQITNRCTRSRGARGN